MPSYYARRRQSSNARVSRFRYPHCLTFGQWPNNVHAVLPVGSSTHFECGSLPNVLTSAVGLSPRVARQPYHGRQEPHEATCE